MVGNERGMGAPVGSSKVIYASSMYGETEPAEIALFFQGLKKEKDEPPGRMLAAMSSHVFSNTHSSFRFQLVSHMVRIH